MAQPIHYVSAASAHPTPPYNSWETAARTIQDAVDATTVASALVLVTNGVYTAGGRAVWGLITNRLAVAKPLVVRSVNGPGVTVIQGYQVPGTTNGGGAIRCAYLTNGAVLNGFTLTNGATCSAGDYLRELSGGGVWCEPISPIVTNCTLTGNSASSYGGGAFGGTLNNCILTGDSAQNGGGVYLGLLNNCTLTSNSALGYGGGASGSRLNNCTVTGNSASLYGGGLAGATANNCVLDYNTTKPNSGSNYDSSSTLNYCCTTPIPTSGTGNITAEPLFVARLDGNLRLQSNSPCINAGSNPAAYGTTDLDGRPRVVGGTVDIGAYEFQGAGFSSFIPWLAQFGLRTDGSADYTDPDGDGESNWQEWVADTNPTNAASSLRLTILSNTPPLGVTFASSAARLYTLLSSTNLTPSSVWIPIPGQTGLPGSGGILTLTDTNAPPSAFYRVSVHFP